MRTRSLTDSRAGAAAKAAYWQSRLDSGDLTHDEKRQYVQWLRESPDHIREILEIAQLAHLLEDARRMSAPALERSGDLESGQQGWESLVEEGSTDARTTVATTAASATISSSYLAHYQRQNRSTKLTLGGLTLLFVAIALLGLAATLPAAALAMAFLAAVMLKEQIVRYRINHGMFGNSASEACALIRFVVDHADSIDFTDGDGKRRPVFERPARSSAHVTSPTGAIAE